MTINYYNYINNIRGDIIMAKKDFDVLEIVEKAAKKLLSDEKLQEQFKKEPIKALEKLLDVNLPDELLEPVIDGIKAKLVADKVGDAAKLLKKLF